jgi:protein-disulfide isomerase
MNIKRFGFWAGFVIILALIVWGLIAAMNKQNGGNGLTSDSPAPVTAADHTIGPDNAPVTLIEYSDFQCPACELYHYVVEQVLASSTVPVRFVYRHFPLPQHPNAVPAAMASEAAGAQGKFWDMYHLIFNDHTEWTELPDPTGVFTGYAAKIGLDMERFKADLGSSTLRDRINRDKDEGIRIGINATPTFFVNGKAIINPQGYEAFKTLIETSAQGGAK